MKIFYTDSKLNKKHSHTVYFGSEQDYIVHKDERERLQVLLKLKDIDNPLSSDYWTAHFCNKYPDMGAAIAEYNEYFMKKNQ